MEERVARLSIKSVKKIYDGNTSVVKGIDLEIEDRGSPHLESLLHAPLERAISPFVALSDITGEARGSTSGRGVLGHA